MLFTPTGTRTFNAVQSNGETRPIEYTIDDEGNAIIIAVDHIKVSDAPLPPSIRFYRARLDRRAPRAPEQPHRFFRRAHRGSRLIRLWPCT